jgi:hypothetical protein
MYTFAFGRFGFSTGLASMFVDSVTVLPNFSRIDFSQKMGYQTDRIILKVPRIEILQIDFRTLIRDRKLYANKIKIKELNFESFRDKRMLVTTSRQPLMPTQMIKGIKFPLSFDTILLSNGYAAYEEQNSDEPGKIFFDRINASLTGFTTFSGITNKIDLHGSARLMGLAPIESWFHFDTGQQADSFMVRATIGEFELTAINPMLSKLMPVSVIQGTTPSTEIIRINAGNAKAQGKMLFRYDNLAVRLYPTKPGTGNRLEQSLLTEVINFLLPDSNPNDEGKLKYGTIYFERDLSKGFFNFLWKSVLSGLKSTMGYNSRAQKEIIREETRRKENKFKR